MSQIGNISSGGSGGSGILTINTIGPNGSGNFTLAAGSGISLTPSTNTITIATTGPGTGLTTANADSGSATVSANAITWAGGTGISTSATGSTVTITLTTPVTVAHGGTGDAAFTVYAPVCGGVTTTGVLQSASTGISNSGYVLTSTGASSLPTWQASGAGIATLDGDTGSATGSTVFIRGGGVTGAGATVLFTAGGSGLGLSTTVASNTFIGFESGNATLSGIRNTIVGSNGAGSVGNPGGSLTSGSYNTVVTGAGAGSGLVDGEFNSFFGYQTGASCVSGQQNICIGNSADLGASVNNCVVIGSSAQATAGTAVVVGPSAATAGNGDVIIGSSALGGSGGNNICIGAGAGSAYGSTESANICLAASGVNAESNVTRIGFGSGIAQQTACYIDGINTASVVGSAVLVDATTGQLGITVSSARFKENIESLASDVSSKLHNLRPVIFNYITDALKVPQVGLIAEEVAQVLPQLVQYGADGLPVSVKYQDLPVLLLNELQKHSSTISTLLSRITDLENQVKGTNGSAS